MRGVPTITITAVLLLAGCGPGASQSIGPSASSVPASPPAIPSPSPVSARPNGTIAFVRAANPDGGGQVDIYLVDTAGPSITRLTNDARLEMDLFWLRDGSHLVYAWSTAPDPYHQTLSSIRADGTDRRDLGPAQTIYSPPAISPDGRTVAFSGDGSDEGTSGLVLLDLVDGTRTQLTSDGGTGAIWSPDGTRLLAFLPSRRVMVIDAASGAELARIDDASVGSVLGWTPDGRSIIYHSCGPDLGKIQCLDAPPLVANADGTNVRIYSGAPPKGAESGLASPDGRWIVTSTAEGRLSVAATTGGPAIDLAVGSDPVWSPDSEWIVFTGTATNSLAGAEGLSVGLFVINREGGTALQITDGPSDQAKAWQPR